MSRRTADRARAVREKWITEKELVSEGRGTRDWTQEQQQSILDIGIAFDENGRAFEGQHMKSVAAYPEYAGNPDNIQFLTRDEHLEAHDGSWKNQTNWYYDPVTKQKTIFDDSQLMPCKVIELSAPIVTIETIDIEGKFEGKDGTGEKVSTTKPNGNVVGESKSNTVRKSFGERLLGAAATVKEFGEKHPVLSGVLKVAGTFAGAYVTTKVGETITKHDSSSNTHDTISTRNNSDGLSKVVSDVTDTLDRISPSEHEVRAHSQRYHTRYILKMNWQN